MVVADVQADKSKQEVAAFCNHFASLKAEHHTFRELFDDERLCGLMEQTAREFFLKLKKLMHEHLLLEFAKLMDPAKSRIKKDVNLENFTVHNLYETINWSKCTKRKLENLVVRIDSFREYLKPARNKILAHSDKETKMSGAQLGEFPEGEDSQFIANVEEICNLMYAECFGIIFGDIGVTIAGDVHDFMKMIGKAATYDELFKASTGEERVKLFELLRSKLSGLDLFDKTLLLHG
jgi:hypothetical protein